MKKYASEMTKTSAPAARKSRPKCADRAASARTAEYYSDVMSANGQAPRVVITGIGAVSPFGVGRESYWHHLSHGISGCRAITQFDASCYPCRVAASVPPVTIDQALPLDGENGDGRADPKRYSRAALFGVIAAREAWCDAGLRAGDPHAGPRRRA